MRSDAKADLSKNTFIDGGTERKTMKKNPNTTARPARNASVWSNLLLTVLVFGVPLAVKLILQNARAASSEQIKATQPMIVPRQGHAAYLLSDGRVYITGGLD